MYNKKLEKIIDPSKLVFKQAFLGAVKITVFVPSVRRQYPISREQIRSCIKRGLHLDKVNAWFTQDSIKAANKKTTPSGAKQEK